MFLNGRWTITGFDGLEKLAGAIDQVVGFGVNLGLIIRAMGEVAIF